MLLLFTPCPGLQEFISKIMLVHYQLDTTKPKPTNPLPPQPAHCLYFYPYDKVICSNPVNQSVSELPRSIIVGPKLYRVDLTMGYNTLVVIVGFHPGGLYRFLGIPMIDMLDQAVDASLLFGSEIENIIQQINEAGSYKQVIQIIESFLIKKAKAIKNILPIDQVLTNLVQRKKPVTIDQLAKDACVSTRQLERQFKERIGLPPKVFSRLVRFSKAWVMRENDPGISWTEIAYACDYSDQMHMIRDFKEFTNVTPGILQTGLENSPLRLQSVSIH